MPLLKSEYRCMKRVLEREHAGKKYDFIDVVREKLGHNPYTYTANHVGVKVKTEQMRKELAKQDVLAVDYIFVVIPHDQGK